MKNSVDRVRYTIFNKCVVNLKQVQFQLNVKIPRIRKTGRFTMKDKNNEPKP